VAFGALRESEPVESPPHPDPLLASGEREQRPPKQLAWQRTALVAPERTGASRIT